MLNMRTQALVIALGLAGIVGTTHAALQAVDPGPYTAATGYFPLYYEDTAATTLDLCLSKAESVNGPMCVLLANPGIFDPAELTLFPFNFPDESFYFTADAEVVGGGVDIQYGAALEAAFGGGVPAPADQIVFARIRIRGDVLQTGTYTVTHPYGTELIDVTAVGNGREINLTRDIGIGAPGDFDGALGGDIGPFLRSVNGPYVAGGETFIGDPNIFETVTGGPNGNVVRVQGPNGLDVQTDLFAVSGRIWDGLRPTNVAVERSTYRRAFGPGFVVETAIDTFANTPDSATASVCYLRRITSPTCRVMDPDGAGGFHLQDTGLLPTSNPPAYVIVTATDDTAVPPTTPTSLASALIDVVAITRAEYDQNTDTLIVEAVSSDEVGVPDLGVLGFGAMQVIAGSATVQRLRVEGVAEPPPQVTVFSTFGGRDVEPVAVVPAIPPNTDPVAIDDAATTAEDTPVAIDVLADNGFGTDSDPDGDPLTVTAVFNVVNGSVTRTGSLVTFTPTADFVGLGGFSYSISDGNGGIATANASVGVTAVNDAPRITSQPVTVAAVGVPYSYDVQASDPDAGDTLAYSLDVSPVGMTIDSATGLIQWTPDAVGNQPVTVRVTDNGAPQALATQSFTVVVAGAVDYDIINLRVTSPVDVDAIGTIRLVYRNNGLVEALRTATVTGTQNGVEIYRRSLSISVPPATNRGVFFTNFRPAQPGDISWQVEIFDDDPDVDQLSRTTVVNDPLGVVDYDIRWANATSAVNVGDPVSVLRMGYTNAGSVQRPGIATLTGTQNGLTVYAESLPINAAPGQNRTVSFPPYTPVEAGNISWSFVIEDEDPDIDQRARTTVVP